MFLGALIQGEPAIANLHGAVTCSAVAYSIPTRGPTSMFSGSGPSKSSRPPKHPQSHKIIYDFLLQQLMLTINIPGAKRGWLDHSVEMPNAWPT